MTSEMSGLSEYAICRAPSRPTSFVLYDSDHVVRFPAKSNTVQDGGAKHVADAIAKTVLAAAPTKRCQVVPLDLIVTNFFEIVKMPNCRR